MRNINKIPYFYADDLISFKDWAEEIHTTGDKIRIILLIKRVIKMVIVPPLFN